MEVMMILLKTGEYLIGFTEELEYEPKCHINQPYRVSTSFVDGRVIQKWPNYTEDEDILINSDSVLTMCEPKNDLRLEYLEMVIPPDIKERANEPLLLQEEAEVDNDEDDTFYVETGIDGML